MSTPVPNTVFRLRSVPWAALAPYTAALEPVLHRVLEGAEAARELGRLLRSLRPLQSDARQALAEAVFGVSLWRRALAHHAGVPELLLATHPKRLLFVLLRDLAGVDEPIAAEASGLAPDSLPARRPASTTPAIRWSLPDWLWQVFESELGGVEEAIALAEALNSPGPVFLRANVARITRESLSDRLAREDDSIETVPTLLSPLGLRVLTPQPNILGSRAHQEGLFEVQDEGSQLLGLLLDARPGHRVLDACAGAGGKTLLLASQLAGEGELHAYDPDRSRLERLERRARHAQAMPIRVHWEPLRSDLLFDRILVDAPCSELGALRRGPDVRFRLDPRSLGAFPELQRRILSTAAGHLAPGGKLLYATCTLRQEENAQVVDAVLQTQPEFQRVRPSSLPSLPDDAFLPSGDVRLLPHRHGTDGFYAALLQRKSSPG